MKDNSDINSVIIKVITSEELTSTEKTMYEEFLADEGSRELVENLKNEAYQLQKLKEIHTIDVVGHKAIIDQKLAIGKRINIKRQGKVFRLRDVATSAAAVVILAAAIFFWLNRKKDKDTVIKEEVKTVAQQDVAPGKANALLTLADGTLIDLAQKPNGTIAAQDEVSVNKKDGALEYKGTNSPLTNDNSLVYNTLSTANAQTYAIVLADGSKVWLNAGASVRYPVVFTGNERKVEITGEVYFEVAHNVNKPFIVHVSGQKGPGMDVQVLGTHFNINAYHNEAVIKTTLLEGSVKIKLNDYQTLLKPGQQSQVGNGMPQVINNVNVDAVVAWKNGRFNFANADIDQVMRQLTRWYDIEVVYEGAKPVDTFIGEMERNLMLSQVVEGLEAMTGLHYRIEGKKLVVLASTTKDPHNNNTK